MKCSHFYVHLCKLTGAIFSMNNSFGLQTCSKVFIKDILRELRNVNVVKKLST